MVPNWDQEIDSILASVDASMQELEVLAKSEAPAPAKTEPVAKNQLPAPKANGGPMKKDDQQPEAKEDKPEDQAPPAPAPEASAPEAPAGDGAPSDAPAPEAEGAPGEAALEQESADAPISDEELKQIYGSMAPEELQRHFMTIREILRGAQPGADAGAQAPAPEAAPAPQAGAPMAMSEKETAVDKESAKKIEDLQKKNEELEKSLGRLAMVMETVFKPERKAVTDIAYIKKSEAEGQEDKQFSKTEIRTLANEKCKDRSLSKSDRDALNDYLLREGSSDKVIQIIKGGK